VLSVDNMNASVSGRESLNGAAEPGRDLLEIDVFDGTKSVRAKNRNASRLETADRTFINFLKLFGPRRFFSNLVTRTRRGSGKRRFLRTLAEATCFAGRRAGAPKSNKSLGNEPNAPNSFRKLGNNWCRIRAKTSEHENAKARQTNLATEAMPSVG
jgi:hypothetical protein